MPEPKKKKSTKKLDNLDYQMLVVKDFIDELYHKTLFKNGKTLDTDLNASLIKSLFAFTEQDQEYPIGELGKNVRVKRSTITDMVDRLERDSIAERVRDNGDRRVVRVRLTTKGKKMRRAFRNRRRAELRVLFATLPEKETRALINHLHEACKILKKIK